tara:strand:- start:4662 stop:8549 length:3888 start_codon:yes stop_codon:yes gene_type:complete
VTRIGASQAFFNIVAQFNAEKLIKDTRSLNTVMKAVSLDTFEAILKPIDDMLLSIDKAVESVKGFGKELGNATVEFEKFYGEAGDLDSVKDDLIGVGESYAFVGTEALAAGSRAAQVANLIGRQNVKLLVEQAAILAEISDLTLEEAQRGIIQLNQQAGILYGDMTRQQIMSLSAREQEIVLTENAAKSLDVLNTVANRSVALEGDLVKTMTNFASGAKLAGDSFEFMAAASATLLEAGEEQGTAGRALRMMYARLGGDINGARTKVEQLGFSFTDQNGQMKSMQGILQELHDKGWGQLNPAMKQNIAQTIAGNRHYVRFIKLMENFERVTQLAADAELRLDSAAGQAEKALSSNVRQLEKMEAKVQNLQAAIGEGLTPFMIGQTEVQAEFLETTEMLTDGLGEAGKFIGRMMGVFKVTQGFVKFGIALQSISIGAEMFASVQRSLQGVEIAVSNLHSKQAAFKGFNVSMTQDEKDILQGSLHIQQTINRLNKEINLNKAEMVQFETAINSVAKERLATEEQISERFERMRALQDEINARKRMEADLAKADGSLYSRRKIRIDYELKTGKELLDVQKSIYQEKAGSEDAFMRQMLADFEVFGNFNAEEKQALRDRNERLREQHSILQAINAENNARRVLRRPELGAGRTDRQGQLALSKEELSVLKETIDGEMAKTNAMLARKTLTQEQRDFFKAQKAEIDQLTKGIDFNTGAVELNDAGFRGLMRTIKQVAGEFFQTERALRTVDAAEKDNFATKNRLKEITRELGVLNRAQKGDLQALNELKSVEFTNNEKMLPILQRIRELDGDVLAQKKEMAKAIDLLTADNNELTESMKRQAAEQYRTTEQFKTDERRARAAQKSFMIGTSNLLGMIGSAFGDKTIGGFRLATLSMGMFAQQVITAGAGAFASAKKLIQLQYNIYRVQLAASGASAGMTKFNAALMTTARVLGPLVAMGGFLHVLQKRGEANQKVMDELSESTMEFESVLSRMDGSTKLFGDDALAKTLGISNYEMHELANNSELTEDLMHQISNHGKSLSGELQKSVAESLNLLQVLNAMQTDAPLLDESRFFELEKLAKDAQTGFMGTNLIGTSLRTTAKDRKVIRDFYERAGAEMRGNESILGMLTGQKRGEFLGVNDASLISGFVGDLVKVMQEGYKFSAEELAPFAEVLGEDLFAIIKQMNALVNTTFDTELAFNRLEKDIEVTAAGIGEAANEIQNLSNEMQGFGNAREELFFGGQFGNVTGSLYKQVVTQGVGTLFHKNEIIMSNNFHGFFNEQAAADRIIAILDQYIETRMA